jgi:hypothetical protein
MDNIPVSHPDNGRFYRTFYHSINLCDVFTTIWIVNIIQSELSHSDTCAPGIMFDGRIVIRIPSKRRVHAQIFLAVLY